MSLPKYKKIYTEMVDDNAELFDQLKSADKSSDEFKQIQRKAIRTVHQYENALCNRSEVTGYQGYSTGLSEKFWELVRSFYPEIDYTAEISR